MTSRYYIHFFFSKIDFRIKGEVWGFEVAAARWSADVTQQHYQNSRLLSLQESVARSKHTTYAHAEEHTHTHSYTAPSVSATHTEQSRNPLKASRRPWKGALKSTSVIQRRRVAIATPVTWYLSAQEWWWGTHCELMTALMLIGQRLSFCAVGEKQAICTAAAVVRGSKWNYWLFSSQILRCHESYVWLADCKHRPQKMIAWDRTETILYILAIF